MTFVIAIDGTGGTGKSTLSQALADRLQVPVLHLDEFGDDFKPFVGLPKLFETLQSMTDPVVIAEGFGIICPQLGDYPNYKILLEAPEALRAARCIARDSAKFDRAIMQQIDTIWGGAERKHFTPELTRSADLVIDSTEPFQIRDIVAALPRHSTSSSPRSL